MTTDQSPESEQAAFLEVKAWIERERMALTDGEKLVAWLAWQEAHRRAHEQAAKICDKIAGNTKDFNADTRRAAGMCAANIRALPEGKHT